MNRGRTRAALIITACLALASGVAIAQPNEASKPAPSDAEKAQPSGAPAAERPQARSRMRERLTRFLGEMREEQVKLEAALKKLDAGEALDDVREALPDRLANRFRDRPAGAGNPNAPGADGPPDLDAPRRAGERFGQGGGRADQPFNEQDWEAVNAIIKHAQPDMLEKFDELRKKDPELAQRRMTAAYPRLRPLLEAYKHDRPGFDLKLEELMIIRKALPLAKEVLELRKQGKTEDSADMKAAREKLREVGKRHYENRMAIMRHDVEMLRQRATRREKDIAEQTANPERGVERSIDGLIKQAERPGGGEPREPRDGERRSPGGPGAGNPERRRGDS